MSEQLQSNLEITLLTFLQEMEKQATDSIDHIELGTFLALNSVIATQIRQHGINKEQVRKPKNPMEQFLLAVYEQRIKPEEKGLNPTLKLHHCSKLGEFIFELVTELEQLSQETILLQTDSAPETKRIKRSFLGALTKTLKIMKQWAGESMDEETIETLAQSDIEIAYSALIKILEQLEEANKQLQDHEK